MKPLQHCHSGLYWSLFTLCVLTLTAAYGDQKATPGEGRLGDSRTIQELQTDLDDLLDDERLQHALIAAQVMSLQSGEMMYHRDADKNLLPASCAKLFTSAAALEILGQEFVFTTSFFLDGIIKRNGEFIGNVIIRGAGDPSLSDAFLQEPLAILEEWCDQFELLGIRSIRGNLVGDDSYFDQVPFGPGWAWDDMPFAYSAEVAALSFFDNKVVLKVRPGDAPGMPASVSMEPANEYVSVRNFVTTIAADSVVDITPIRALASNVVELHGAIAWDSSAGGAARKERTFEIAVANPTLFTLHLLKHSLQRRGIRFRGSLYDSEGWGDKIYYSDLRPVFEHTSPSLKHIITTVNQQSHNLAADMLLKTMAKESTGEGSFDKGAEILRGFASRHGIAPESFALVDGSGLSRLNLLSARQIVQLLKAMYASQHRDVYIQSLAQPGADGTLAKRMRGSRAESRVFAKTGSMNHTSTIAGYVYSRDSEVLAFSIMMNNSNAAQSVSRSVQDLFCMRLAGFTRHPAKPDGHHARGKN